MATIDVTVHRGTAEPAAWRDLLAAAASPGFTHRGIWTRALADRLPGRSGLWLIASAGDRAVAGLSLLETRRGPFRIVEGHYDGTCGAPLVADGLDAAAAEAAVAALLAEFDALTRRPAVLTTALHLPPTWDRDLQPRLTRLGFAREAVSVAVMPLSQGLDHVEYHLLKKNRRNERNKALRRGCVLGVTDDPAVLDEFYPVYQAAARRWGAAPVARGLLEDLLDGGGGEVFCTTVRFEGGLLGAHYNYVDGDTVIAWLAATVPERSKEFFPSTLLVWADLEEACRRGAAWLDLGAHGGQSGVANFKKLLGAEEIVRGSYVRHSAGGRLWRRLRRLRGGWRR
jgi:CelD/BcsL family acetyltransferase involved in cellulose biosynthesis